MADNQKPFCHHYHHYLLLLSHGPALPPGHLAIYQIVAKIYPVQILRQLDLLEDYGHLLGLPHVKKIDQNLFELRIRGKQEIRLIFTFHKQACYILHGFIKKTQQIPQWEITTALKRMP